jgi:hypothetical protein
MGPELLRMLELLEDRQCPADLHAAVGLEGGRIAEFAEPSVAGARVVPAIGGLAGKLGSDFDDVDREPRLELLEHRRQARRHDAAADQQHVRGGRHGGRLEWIHGRMAAEEDSVDIPRVRMILG